MATAEDTLMDWLRDAHAMEAQAEQMLSSMSGRLTDYPGMKEAVDSHLQETKTQRARIESCIVRRGGDTSTLKDWTAKALGLGQGYSGVLASDEVVKGAMAGYTFEHMEIAAYRALISAAEAVQDNETAETCAAILTEEERAAEKLYGLMPAVVARYIAREEEGKQPSASA